MLRTVTTGKSIYTLIDKHWMLMGEDGGVIDFADEQESCLLDLVVILENIIADPSRNWADR